MAAEDHHDMYEHPGAESFVIMHADALQVWCQPVLTTAALHLRADALQLSLSHRQSMGWWQQTAQSLQDGFLLRWSGQLSAS